VTHNELQEDLAGHLRGASDRMVWTNTQLGPSGSPRPDVFTVAKSFARFRTDCYEIKVSVSDLRHDVTSGKWQSYRKFGHAVWFAFPRGMAPLDLVPKECGVILHGEGWRSARKPVAQVLDTLPRDAWLKLLMSDGPEEGRAPRPRHMDEWTAAQLAREKWGKELAELLEARTSSRRQYEHATARLRDSAAEIEKDMQRRKQLAEDQLRRDMGGLDAAVTQLAEALGLQGDITIPQVTRAVHALQSRLDPWQLDRAIACLTEIKGRLKPAVEVGAA
jgi:hypothetical protein